MPVWPYIYPERSIGQTLDISRETERETFGHKCKGLENTDYIGRLKWAPNRVITDLPKLFISQWQLFCHLG